jgi:hypothetical protein
LSDRGAVAARNLSGAVWGKGLVLLALWVGSGVGCNAPSTLSETEWMEQQGQELIADNGLSTNGLSTNGLSTNGLSTNGLSTNGLSTNGLAMNGLSSSSFSSWFQQSPALANLVMTYMVRCAVPAGQSRTYSDGVSTYTWPGSLGLAPAWSSGSPATLAEQQIISACLGAHANKYGKTVPISVLGTDAQGQSISYTSAELADFSQREACFFGNLFNGEGVFVGNDQPLLPTAKSSLRACALASGNSATSSACSPMVHTGSCATSCQLDATGTYYTQCTRNGISYRPITSRIRTQEIVTCGDGICQASEVCGKGNRSDDCGVDCGACG